VTGDAGTDGRGDTVADMLAALGLPPMQADDLFVLGQTPSGAYFFEIKHADGTVTRADADVIRRLNQLMGLLQGVM
jgi:hypothetical protein